MNKVQTRVKYIRRVDSEWVADLSGKCGGIAQEQAFEELTNYLFVVVYNNLCARRATTVRLSQFADEELCELAMDFTQQFMVKIIKDEFALLEKYHAIGRFTTWAAQVALNIVRSEFRRARWTLDATLYERIGAIGEQALPDMVLVNTQIREILQAGITQLPSQMQTVFVRRMINGESTSALAAEMNITPNTVSLMMNRAKKRMRRFLLDAGIDGQGMMFLSE